MAKNEFNKDIGNWSNGSYNVGSIALYYYTSTLIFISPNIESNVGDDIFNEIFYKVLLFLSNILKYSDSIDGISILI